MESVFCTYGKDESSLPLRVWGMGRAWEQEAIDRPSGYPNHQFLYCRSGSGELVLRQGAKGGLDGKKGGNGSSLGQGGAGDRLFRIRPGQGAFLLPDEAHRYQSRGGEPWILDWVVFEGGMLGGGSPSKASAVKAKQGHSLLPDSLAESRVFPLARGAEFGALFAALWNAAARQPGGDRFRGSAICYELLMLVAAEAAAFRGEGPRAGGEERSRGDRGILDPLLAAIEADLSRPPSTEALAKMAGMSRQHLCRIFSRTMGASPGEYILMLRLNRAKALLGAPGVKTVREAALTAGFSDVNYFCRVFKAREGVTPLAFRKRLA